MPVDNVYMNSLNQYVKIETQDTPLEKYNDRKIVFELDPDNNMFIPNYEEAELEKALPVKDGSALEGLLSTS